MADTAVFGQAAGVTLIYLVQHAEKERHPGDPGLTDLGRRQAARTAEWLRQFGLRAVSSSPLRRARETAGFIAARTGLSVQRDDRLRERMNWDGARPKEEFLRDWMTTVADRDFIPPCGDSSRAAAERLRACLIDVKNPGPAVLVTHGGVTVDLLRTLIGDRAVPIELLRQGVPSCAVTTLEHLSDHFDLSVVGVASVAHLE